MNQHLSVPLEIKSLKGRKFEGYGSIFGNVDLGYDVVVKGAFKQSLTEHKNSGTLPVMFWMHQPDQVPGVWTHMEEDSKGLYVEGELVETSLGKDVNVLLEKKAVRGLSIGYQTVDADYKDDGVRLLKQVKLHEVSIVSMAMNPLAQVEALKTARLSQNGEYVPTAREFEQYLRTMGCSRSVAVALTAKLFDGTGEVSGMLTPSPRGNLESTEDDEMKQLLQKLGALQDNVYATALKY
jgi:HK97 family phage prohead protease